MKVEVVLAQVREDEDGEPYAEQSLEGRAVRCGLHRAASVSGVEHLAEEALDVDRLGRRPHRGAPLSPDAVFDRSEETRSAACGGDRDRTKRPLMGEIVARLADSAIVTSDNPRSEAPQAIIDEIVAGMPGEPETVADREAAITLALERAGEGDVVVIAGKGHEQGQEFADRIVPFDDREVAREALRRLAARA